MHNLLTDLTKTGRFRQVQEKLVELTPSNQESAQALALLVLNMEQSIDFGQQENLHLPAHRIDDRLQEVSHSPCNSFGSKTPVELNLAVQDDYASQQTTLEERNFVLTLLLRLSIFAISPRSQQGEYPLDS